MRERGVAGFEGMGGRFVEALVFGEPTRCARMEFLLLGKLKP